MHNRGGWRISKLEWQESVDYCTGMKVMSSSVMGKDGGTEAYVGLRSAQLGCLGTDSAGQPCWRLGEGKAHQAQHCLSEDPHCGTRTHCHDPDTVTTSCCSVGIGGEEAAHLADPGQVGEAAQIGVLHGPRLWPAGRNQQPRSVQLRHQLCLHLRVL